MGREKCVHHSKSAAKFVDDHGCNVHGVANLMTYTYRSSLGTIVQLQSRANVYLQQSDSFSTIRLVSSFLSLRRSVLAYFKSFSIAYLSHNMA